jgi:protein-L-isoaspartate(D-aspartate) O-methyltransferase
MRQRHSCHGTVLSCVHSPAVQFSSSSSSCLDSLVAASALTALDRANFVPPAAVDHAYQDTPLCIGHGATISAPHMHAMCLELLDAQLQPGAHVLDVGSGSGYLTAAMAVLVGETGVVVGIEHVPQLTEWSKDNVAKQPRPDFVPQICVRPLRTSTRVAVVCPVDWDGRW